MEVLEHLTDRFETGRHGRTDHIVGLLGELTARRRWSHRNRDYYLGRLGGPHRTHRGAHACARGDAVIDQDRGLARDVDGRPSAAIRLLSAVALFASWLPARRLAQDGSV